MTRATAPIILSVQGLSFAYPGQPPLFSGWSADVPAGVSLLYGDSGSGKSTLLRVLAGTFPANGNFAIDGARLAQAPELYRQRVFLTDANDQTFDPITPNDYATTMERRFCRFDAAVWQRHAEAFGLGPHREKPLYQLSTGSKRKVWLAAALACGCPLILLDEPTAALDLPSIQHLKRALTDLATQKKQAVLVASYSDWDDVPLATTLHLPPP